MSRDRGGRWRGRRWSSPARWALAAVAAVLLLPLLSAQAGPSAGSLQGSLPPAASFSPASFSPVHSRSDFHGHSQAYSSAQSNTKSNAQSNHQASSRWHASRYQRESVSPVGGGVDLAFRAEHLRSDHCYAARCREQRRKRVGFELYEAARVQVQPGLFGGWIRLRQDDPRDDVRLRFDGHYLGVGLRSHLFASAPLSLLASTSLTWYSVSGDAEAGESEIEWLELLGRFGPVVRLGDLWLHAGLSALRSDGDQDWADGASEHFREDRNYGGFARLTVRVDETGYVGFNLEGGAREGFSVVMGRLF